MSEVQQRPNEVTAQAVAKTLAGKIAILVTGQVGMTGKSTVSANVLHPRLGGRLFSVDSVNQDAKQYGAEVEAIFAADLHEMRVEMLRTSEPIVVDLGASDFTTFVQQMAAANMARPFNYVVIVTDTSRRGQEEAIGTYETLCRLGMPTDRFRFVLNKATIGARDRAIHQQFPVLFAYKRANPNFPLNENCYLPDHGLFRALHESGQTFKEALNDRTGYDPLITTADLEGDDATAITLSRKALAQALAASMEEYFEHAYKELDIQPKR
ncbi:hypothetical protein [Paraburkholderia tuberum]|nr:hypothetical protein [Paraburkholderia tuberum]